MASSASCALKSDQAISAPSTARPTRRASHSAVNWREKRASLSTMGPTRRCGCRGDSGRRLARVRGRCRQDELRVREGRRSGVGAAHVVASAAARSMVVSLSRRGRAGPCDGRPQGDQGADRSRLMTGHRQRRAEVKRGRAARCAGFAPGDAGWIYSPGSLTGRHAPLSSPMSVRVPSPARSPRRPPRRAERRPAARRRLRFGVDAGDCAAASIGPLLIVAGAGSGKTLTLAARVARLVLAGADPSRLLLLTFSRRAALEMERRVGRVLHEALGLAPLQQAPRLAWCGTFHSVGARLLRGVAARIGLDESFTVDDRADSEDLIHLLRQRLGLASGARRFPQKGTCLAIYSRAVNARRPLADVLAETFPWCSDHEDALRRLFAAYAEEKQAQRVLDFDDLLVWWAEAMADPGRRRADRVALRPCARRRVPGHQPPAGRDRPAPAPGRQRPHRRRRRRPVDLLVPRRRGAQHPRLRRLLRCRRRPC